MSVYFALVLQVMYWKPNGQMTGAVAMKGSMPAPSRATAPVMSNSSREAHRKTNARAVFPVEL